MAQRRGNVIPGDDSEISPNPQNLATALAVIGQTARKYVIELVGVYINTDFGVSIWFHHSRDSCVARPNCARTSR